MHLIDQIKDDRNAVVIDAQIVLEIADQMAASEVDVGKVLRVAVAPWEQPAGLDPRFQHLHLDLAGEWRVSRLSEMDKAFANLDLAGVRHVRVNTTGLSVLDFSAAWYLREFLDRVRQLDGRITFDGAEPEQLRLIADCQHKAPYSPPAASDEGGIEPVEALGRQVVRRWRDVVAALEGTHWFEVNEWATTGPGADAGSSGAAPHAA